MTRAGVVASLAVIFSASACSDLPDVTGGSCGNHVVEAASGEECDDAQPGCGAPGTAGACRLACKPDGTCREAGYVCGRDGVCRVPTGQFTVGQPFGGPNDDLRIVDYDGDGLLDVLDRATNQVSLFHNDGDRSMTQAATGAMLPPVGSQSYPASVGFAPGFELPTLIAAPNVYGSVGLHALTDRGIVAVAVADSIVPQKHATYIGGLRVEPAITYFSLLYWDGNLQVDAYHYTVEGPAAHDATLDLTRCGITTAPATIGLSHLTPRGASSSRFVLLLDGDGNGTESKTAICVGTAHDDSFDVEPLDLAPLDGREGSLLAVPRLADFDGDGIVDVASLYHEPAFDGVVLFRGRAAGGFGPAEPIAVSFYDTGYNLAAADFDGDGRADLAYATVLYHNTGDTGGADGGVTDGGVPDGGSGAKGPGFEFATVLVTGVYSGAIDEPGDFNHDGHPDVAVSTDSDGNVGVCEGDGTGVRFGCAIVPTPLPSVLALDVGDVNGDSTDDVIGASPGVSQVLGDGGVVMRSSGIATILGRAGGPPDPSATGFIPAVGGSVEDIRPSFSPYNTPDDVQVPITTTDGHEAIAFGEGELSGLLHFDFSAINHDSQEYVDVAFQRRDGSLPDLVLLAWEAVDTILGNQTGNYASGPRTIALPDGLLNDPDAFPAFVRLPGPGDGDLAVTWATAMGVFVERVADGKAVRVSDAAVAPLSGPWFAGASDLDGDGRDELVYFDGGNGADCRLFVLTTPTGAMLPTAKLAATIPGCAGGDYAFADVAPPDGKLDLVMQLSDRSFVLAPQLADGTFDTTHLGPPPVTVVPPHGHWVASRDLDGDGVVDVLFQTPAGAVVTWAGVARR